MKIKGVCASVILNSRSEKTIQVEVLTGKGKFVSSAPSGESKGRFESKPYFLNLKGDINFLNKIKPEILRKFKINEFKDLREIEGFVGKNIGANSLFALEACLLKALAKENKKSYGNFLEEEKYPILLEMQLEVGYIVKVIKE